MAKTADGASAARLRTGRGAEGELTIEIAGRLDAESTGTVWAEATGAVDAASAPRAVLDATNLAYCDGAGIGLLVEIHRRQRAHGGSLEMRGVRDEVKALLDQFPIEGFEETAGDRKRMSVFEDAGRRTMKVFTDAGNQIAFLGEVLVEIGRAVLKPRSLRWKDVIHTVGAVGADAVPIMSLMGLLIGLIIAYQSAAGLKPFGAEVYTADALSLSLVRELGPIMTGIILAARSGSAFAAEIGTMKVNEEIDALASFGFSPVRFLVLPRMLGGMFVTPLLLVLNIVAGLVGGAPVVMSYGYPLVTYVNRCRGAVGLNDAAFCLTKGFVFGAIIAGIGCLRGLQTGSGAQAVGESTTRSVVTSIVLIIVFDFAFAIIGNTLGI